MTILLNKIYHNWSKLTHLGVKEDMPVELVIKTRLMTIIYLVVCFWSISLMIISLFVGNLEHFFIVFGAFLFQSICAGLSIFQRQSLAWILLIVVFSTYFSVFWIFIDSQWDTGFLHLIIVFLVFIFFKGTSQLLLILYVCLTYLGAPIIDVYIPEIYKNQIETFPYVTEYSFGFYAILSAVILNFYQKNIIKNRETQSQIIQKLKKTNIHLNLYNKKLEQFINVVIGELKRKLQIIRLQNSQIQGQIKNNQTENVSNSIVLGISTAQQMYFWVNDILEFSNIHQTSSKISEVQLEDIIDEIKMELELTTSKRILIQQDKTPLLFANYQEIKVIFQHLIENILEHHSSINSIISIHCQKSSDYLIFYLASKEFYLEKGMQKHTFEDFKRTHDETSNDSTLGLGIVNKIIQKMNGIIDWQPSEGFRQKKKIN